MPGTVVVTQSNYLPWKGYFDQLMRADQFILLDCVQYTRRDWRNRNKIKTATGPRWITVPVEVKGRYDQAIDETRIADPGWAERHCAVIAESYREAGCFASESAWLFDSLRAAAEFERLSDINRYLLKALAERVGIRTPVIACDVLIPRAELRAMEPTARLVSLARAAGANVYLSGPAAKAYLDLEAFAAAGIEVVWMDYSGYPTYPQQWGAFDHGLSIVDLLLNVGHDNVIAFIQRDQVPLGLPNVAGE